MQRNLCSLLIIVLFVGCIPIDNNVIPPQPQPVAPSAGKQYLAKMADIFAEAASKLKSDRDVAAVHDFLKINLTSARKDSFAPIDKRLNDVLGVENPDIDAGVKLLEEIGDEFKEAAK